MHFKHPVKPLWLSLSTEIIDSFWLLYIFFCEKLHHVTVKHQIITITTLVIIFTKIVKIMIYLLLFNDNIIIMITIVIIIVKLGKTMTYIYIYIIYSPTHEPLTLTARRGSNAKRKDDNNKSRATTVTNSHQHSNW